MNFGAEDNAKVVRHSTSEVYVQFLVGLPATSAPNIALSHRFPSSSGFHQSQLIHRCRSLYTSFRVGCEPVACDPGPWTLMGHGSWAVNFWREPRLTWANLTSGKMKIINKWIKYSFLPRGRVGPKRSTYICYQDLKNHNIWITFGSYLYRLMS